MTPPVSHPPLFPPPPPPSVPTLVPVPDLARRQQFAATLDFALATHPVQPDHPFKLEDLHDDLFTPSHLHPVPPPPPPPVSHHSVHPIPHVATSPVVTPPKIAAKPIHALGPMCFAGFYLVSLTRTLVRNRTVPRPVRRAFMAPQVAFAFTVRDRKSGRWRHVPTVNIAYERLTAAGEWIAAKMGVNPNVGSETNVFKMVKDALQKAVTESWGNARWEALTRMLSDVQVDWRLVEEAVDSDGVAGKAHGTPLEYFDRVNCHKNAADIRRDVDGAISARETLRWVINHLGLDPAGRGIPVETFRDRVWPMWRAECEYVAMHGTEGCCGFWSGGYFKKIMVHRHLYSIDSCVSTHHVKDLFEGLDEVIKVWSNPTGMCVREAKCAAGLRYNVDKSFQSGIRSYCKAKYLEAAPHTAQQLADVEADLLRRVRATVYEQSKRWPKCRSALIKVQNEYSGLRESRKWPEELGGARESGLRKRKREGSDSAGTPREQKRKHAHLSLKRKEKAERTVKEYLEKMHNDVLKLKKTLECVERHGEGCECEEATGDAGRDWTTANVPVA